MQRLITILALIGICSFSSSLSADALRGPSFKPVDGFASNLGRTILLTADVVAEGTLGRAIRHTGGMSSRAFVISNVLWGSAPLASITINYSDDRLFEPVGDRIAVALMRVTKDRTYEPIGKPIDLRTKGAIQSVKDLIEVDATPKTIHQRASEVKSTLLGHLAHGGMMARFASIEMIYLVNFHPQVFARVDYEVISGLAKKADENTRIDLRTAMRHLVYRVLKRDAQVALSLAAGDRPAEVAAIQELDGYFKAHPNAFGSDDIERMALAEQKLSEKNARYLINFRSRIDQHLADRREALIRLKSERPNGLTAFGNAGDVRNREWSSAATKLNHFLDNEARRPRASE